MYLLYVCIELDKQLIAYLVKKWRNGLSKIGLLSKKKIREAEAFFFAILQMLLYGESGRPFKHFIVVLLKSHEIILSFKG